MRGDCWRSDGTWSSRDRADESRAPELRGVVSETSGIAPRCRSGPMSGVIEIADETVEGGDPPLSWFAPNV